MLPLSPASYRRVQGELQSACPPCAYFNAEVLEADSLNTAIERRFCPVSIHGGRCIDAPDTPGADGGARSGSASRGRRKRSSLWHRRCNVRLHHARSKGHAHEEQFTYHLRHRCSLISAVRLRRRNGNPGQRTAARQDERSREGLRRQRDGRRTPGGETPSSRRPAPAMTCGRDRKMADKCTIHMYRMPA